MSKTIITPPRAAIIDELGKLDAELAAMKPKEARRKELSEQVIEWFQDEPAEKAVAASGARFTVVVSPRGNQRSILSIPKLFKRLGERTFLTNCSIALGALDNLLTKAEIGKFVGEARTGPRKVTTAARVVD